MKAYGTCAVLCVACLLAAPTVGLAGEARDLFLPGPAAKVAKSSIPRASKRARHVRIDGSLFEGRGAPMRADTLPSLRLQLFDDADYVVVFDRVDQVGRNGLVWIGHVEGADGKPGDKAVEGSFVTLTSRGGAVAGGVQVPGKGSYGIRYAGNGVHVVWEHDPAKASRKLPSPRRPAVAKTTTGGAASPATSRRPLQKSGDTVLDVMILYTDAAETAAGGPAQIAAQIDLAFSQLNLTLVNSEVDVEANLVHTEKVAYAETGNVSTDLDNLTFTDPLIAGTEYWPGTGALDAIHAIRDQYGADTVCLFVASADGAGLGWELLPGDTSASFGPWAFSVVELASAALPTAAFAHETGHNMGCGHEGDPAYYFDSTAHDFGTLFVPPNTMMIAVGDAIPYFSNPGVIYPGNGEPSGVVNVSDNARALGAAVPNIVSLIRDNVWPEVSITSPLPGAVLSEGDNVPVSATATDLNGNAAVAAVTFMVDGADQGSFTDAGKPSWAYTWASAPAGVYVLSARAMDDGVAHAPLVTPPAARPVVTVRVNDKPVVSITSPAGGSTYQSGDTVSIIASAWDPATDGITGSIVGVDFYYDSNYLGTDLYDGDNTYQFDWVDAPSLFASDTTVALTAVATDDEGLAATSTPVSIDLTVDSDGDGLPDWWEYDKFGDLSHVSGGDDDLDTDGVTVIGDGLTNLEEYQLFALNGWDLDPLDPDTDGDTLLDGDEVNVSPPYQSDPTLPDSDFDGLDDAEEQAYGTIPMDADSDGDLMSDGWEAAYWPDLDPLVADGGVDADGDGYANYQEYIYSTNPRDPNSHPGARDVGCVPSGGAGTGRLAFALAAAAFAAWLTRKLAAPPVPAPSRCRDRPVR